MCKCWVTNTDLRVGISIWNSLLKNKPNISISQIELKKKVELKYAGVLLEWEKNSCRDGLKGMVISCFYLKPPFVCMLPLPSSLPSFLPLHLRDLNITPLTRGITLRSSISPCIIGHNEHRFWMTSTLLSVWIVVETVKMQGVYSL